jgi:hypothetical protein
MKSDEMERVKGIEPSYSAWKAAALPLSYTRDFNALARLHDPHILVLFSATRGTIKDGSMPFKPVETGPPTPPRPSQRRGVSVEKLMI